MSILNVGIVGLGEATQILHLPALRQLSGQFRVTALCDVSPTVLDGVSAEHPAAQRYRDYRELVKDPGVDVVLVANPHAYHTTVAIPALEAGKHVFIEKPMSMSMAEADALQQAEDRSGKLVQVGYMRRYSDAFVEAVGKVHSERDTVRFARVHDFIGQNQLIIDDTSAVIRGNDVPQTERAALEALEAAKMQEAIGTNDPALSLAYNILLGLSSHDISAMRELLGMPKRVLSATSRQGGLYLTATFDYGPFVCEFATGIDALPRFDTFLEVYTDTSVTRIDYDTPYIRNIPARLTRTQCEGAAGVRQSVSFPSRRDAFVVEWQAFHEHVESGTKPKTTVADARQDLEIFDDIMTLLKQSHEENAHVAD